MSTCRGMGTTGGRRGWGRGGGVLGGEDDGNSTMVAFLHTVLLYRGQSGCSGVHCRLSCARQVYALAAEYDRKTWRVLVCIFHALPRVEPQPCGLTLV